MQTKLTLRIEDAVVRKAKHLARKRGTSVSRMFSDFIAEEPDQDLPNTLGDITASMVGVLSASRLIDDKQEYRNHLEEKHR